MSENIVRGYLDVKISLRSRRGFTPWKAWKRQWCEISRLDDIIDGLKLTFKSSVDGNILNCIKLPRSATLCRTDSRTKSYAFGVFNFSQTKKPLVFLSGISESESQDWMMSIRRMLSIASYIPSEDPNFRISLVDNTHSRNAGLLGLFGVMSMNPQEIVVSDPTTGCPKIVWNWYNFHQFHMQAPLQSADDKRIVVMHTSREFAAGPGQIYLYCRDASLLLQHLLSRGIHSQIIGLNCSKRFSKSEGDLCRSKSVSPDSPICFRSQAGSDDSGAPGYQVPDCLDRKDVECVSIHFALSAVTKTPGESETEDSCSDLRSRTEFDFPNRKITRNESGISLASGIYEEISEADYQYPEQKGMPKRLTSHVYENPIDMIFADEVGKLFKPPPLPPRTMTLDRGKYYHIHKTPIKQRCNTLPAKDLSKISQMFYPDNEYVIMSPAATLQRHKKPSACNREPFFNYHNFPINDFSKEINGETHKLGESIYLPMSPVIKEPLKKTGDPIYLPMSSPNVTSSFNSDKQCSDHNIYLPMSPALKLPVKITDNAYTVMSNSSNFG